MLSETQQHEEVGEQALAYPAGHHPCMLAVWQQPHCCQAALHPPRTVPHLLCEDWNPGRNKRKVLARVRFMLLIISIFGALQRQWRCRIALAPCIGNEWELHTVSIRASSSERFWREKKALYTLKNKYIQPGTFKYVSSSECWLMLHWITIKKAPKAHFLVCKRVIMINFTNTASRFWGGLCVQKKY